MHTVGATLHPVDPLSHTAYLSASILNMQVESMKGLGAVRTYAEFSSAGSLTTLSTK